MKLISGDVWTSVCAFRITLYRQRVSLDFCDHAQDVRFAYFQKCEGIMVKDEDAMNVPFLITVSSYMIISDSRTTELMTWYFQKTRVMVYKKETTLQVH